MRPGAVTDGTRASAPAGRWPVPGLDGVSMVRLAILCGALVLAAASCAGGEGGATAPGPSAVDPAPPTLPDDFTWTGRYLVPDLDVEVPFTWHGDGGDVQMVAGGEGQPIHFTNVISDGQLYTLTYEWPEVPRHPCSHVGPFTVDELNEGFAGASFVGRETLHGDPDREVHHFRSTAVWELPTDLLPPMEGVPQLRIPVMSGDLYVDVDDPGTIWRLLHFGVQNLYDPHLDEWIFIDEAKAVAGPVTLPEECTAAR